LIYLLMYLKLAINKVYQTPIFHAFSMSQNNAATIADIARHAGVGTATVDRVLNKRPGVNAQTTQKVMDAIRALGEPTVLRGRPRQKDRFRFAYVLPEADTPFFNKMERLIAQAAGDFRHQHITEVTHRLNTDDPARFAVDLLHIGDYDGIALVAPDLPAIKLAINELVRAGAHVVTLFSDVAGSMREAFIGADNRAAGRTAGLLLARMAVAPGHDTLLLLSQATRMSGEIERRIGFVQVLEERFPHLKVARQIDLPTDEEGITNVLHKVFAQDVDITRLAGVYSVGVGTGGVVQALATQCLAVAPGLVAHDFTEQHQSLLLDGSLSYVLHQDVHYCVLAAARVLLGLCENVRGALNVVQPRVEILTAENLH
jgi:LacI family transcriptional regulator